MTTAPKDSQQYPDISQRTHSTGVTSVVISLITGPFLVTLMGVRALTDTLEQAGIVSEELFRGVRLPNLSHASSTESGAIDHPQDESAGNS